MEQAANENFGKLDEAVLSNAFAWMRKCKDDGLAGKDGVPFSCQHCAHDHCMRSSCDSHRQRLHQGELIIWGPQDLGLALADVYELLQRVLQIYAAQSLVKGASSGGGIKRSSDKAEVCLDAVISARPATWADTLWRETTLQQVSESAFSEALQRRMEGVVLNLQSGSHAQRVQAEFLKEVELTSEEVFKNKQKK